MNEQRRYSRIPFEIGARLDGPEGSQDVHVADISLKGVLLHLQSPIPSEPAGGYQLAITLSAEVEIAMRLELVHLAWPSAGFVCRRIELDSLSHLRRLFEFNLADPELLQRDLSELGGA